MIVTPTGQSGSASTGTQVERASGGMGKSDFMRLLTAQLRHQDPLNPMQDQEMMAQLAQFSALEETQAMRTALDKLAASDLMSQGASFLGKKVTGKLPPSYDAYGNQVPGKEISGVVSGVRFRDGAAILTIGNEELSLANVTDVEQAG